MGSKTGSKEINRTAWDQNGKTSTVKDTGNRRTEVNDRAREHRTGKHLYAGLTKDWHDAGEGG